MKVNIFLTIIFISLIAFAFEIQYPTGIVGLTEKDGAIGCICHNFEKTDSVFVWIEGPDSLVPGSSAVYKLFLSGGPAVSGGFNLAALRGKVYSIDSLTQRMEHTAGDTQLTHTQPLSFTGDTIFWRFVYQAPDSVTTDTLYSVANSVNGDGIPTSDDMWNFGRKFSITIYDAPISVDENKITANDFVLYQNYPNPFNPSTNISWKTNKAGRNIIKLYDINGNEIEKLVDGYFGSGFHSFIYQAKSSMTSGVYLLRLITGNQSQTKKIILMK
jgi:hypothetical protein